MTRFGAHSFTYFPFSFLLLLLAPTSVHRRSRSQIFAEPMTNPDWLDRKLVKRGRGRKRNQLGRRVWPQSVRTAAAAAELNLLKEVFDVNFPLSKVLIPTKEPSASKDKNSNVKGRKNTYNNNQKSHSSTNVHVHTQPLQSSYLFMTCRHAITTFRTHPPLRQHPNILSLKQNLWAAAAALSFPHTPSSPSISWQQQQEQNKKNAAKQQSSLLLPD